MYVSIGGPVFLIAVGAILRYATNFDVSGIEMDTVGLILMIAGAVMLVFSLVQAFVNRPTEPASKDRQPPSRPPPPR